MARRRNADLRQRPAANVNGDKRLWAAASFVNFIGPVSYFALGRKGATVTTR